MSELFDQRQSEFLKNFYDPKSPTWDNATQSALKAGYSQEYSENITHLMPNWLSESIGDTQLIKKAEKNLNKFLDDNFEDEKIKADVTKFVLSRLNKQKYSERTEHTGSNGEALPILVEFINAKENNTNTTGVSETV